MALAQVFHALGDPVRLEMVQRLTDGGPRTIAAVSSGLGMSRQGARKHLQVLSNAGIVSLEPQGRDVLVRLDSAQLESAKSFIAELERRWAARLGALKRLVEAPD